jgi:GT2 family glycosyltransferase
LAQFRTETLADREAKIAALDQALAQRDRELGGLRDAQTEREVNIAMLQSTISALRRFTSRRITARLRFAKGLLARFRYSAVGYPLTLCWQVLRTRSRAPLRYWRATRAIVRSGMFDREWYIMTNPDVARCGIDPVRHYVAFGAREGREPSPSFSTRDYLSHNPDVAAAGLDPLSHFILYGASEGRVGGCTGSTAFSPQPTKVSASITTNTTVMPPALLDLAGNTVDLKVKYRRKLLSELSAFLSSGNRIKLPTCDQPKVSIIVVLFNQAELTFECLRALADAIDIAAEVIIVDNASTDLTKELCAQVIGAHVIRNEENAHFLQAVNQAAPATRGDAVLLLNNDTRITFGSISVAHQLLQEKENIGAVGGKIILLDGSVQEAGCIIWSDGSCFGYARGRTPSDPELQFRRDVDYCSGAFLLVRRSLFERLNWFDTTFSPAYYEDSDLCMRIREAGFRVVYEPRVEILHFEFGSSSSLEAAIALQQRNQAIFVKRHRTALQKFHHDPGIRPFDARMNNRYAGRVLVIDDRVPDPVLGSGFPRARSIMQGLHEAGWFITFYPLNFPIVSWDDAYRCLAREVEVIADQGLLGLEPFIRSRIGYYDAVLVSRPHNMVQFKQAIISHPEFLKTTTLIYDAEAIFSAREAGRLKLAGRSLSPSSYQRMINEEIALSKDAAIVLAVSEAEARVFREAVNAEVQVLGHAVVAEPTSAAFNNRSNILFVGALDDDESPNVDSLVWFVRSAMPLLDRLLGATYRLNVVGRNGSLTARELAGDRVHFFGMVLDLSQFYSTSRIFVAPTRYGAGMPMKVHESAAVGLPLVATSLLASQLGWKDGCELLVADDPENFASACFHLYSDEKVWSKLRANALERIKHDCSPSQFSARLASVLAAVGR